MYFNQLPLFVKSLTCKVWCIGCSETEFPKTVIQVLKLGPKFVPLPSIKDWDLVLKEFPKVREKVKTNDGRWLHLLPKIKDLLKKDYMITDTDKNMGPAIITKLYYHELSMNILKDDSTFIKSELSEEKIIYDYHESLSKIPVTRDLKLLEDIVRELPVLVGLPKVHKNPVKLRPVVNASNTFTSNLSKLLAKFLMQVVKLFERRHIFNIKKADEFLNRIRNVQVSREYSLDALDIKSLYTNIPLELIYQAVEFSLEFNQIQTVKLSYKAIKSECNNYTLIRLLRIYIEYNFLSYKYENTKQIFKQVKGIPTGGNASPAIAMLTLIYKEIMFENEKNSIWAMYTLSARYLDDWIIITSDPLYSAKRFQSLVYDNLFELEESCSREETFKPFLDLQITIEGNQFVWKLFRKEGNAYMYPHFKSYIPKSVKKGVIVGETIRYYRRNKYKHHIEQELTKLTGYLINRGYPEKFIRSTIDETVRKVKDGKYDKLLHTKQDYDPTIEWLPIHYIHSLKTNEVLELIDMEQPSNGNYPRNKICFRNHRKLIQFIQ